MQSRIAAAVGVSVLTAAVALSCTSSNAPSAPLALAPGSAVGDGDVGALRLELTLPDGEFVGTVAYVLSTGAGVAVRQGTVSTGSGPTVALQLGSVPADDGYTVTLTASFDGGGRCFGSAGPFTVPAHATVAERVALQCTTPLPDAGNVAVNAVVAYCAAWTSLSSVAATGTGSEVNVGFTIELTATAIGPDPSALTYSWSQSNPIGTFGPDSPSGTSDSISFTCVTPGTTQVTLVVADGSLPEAGLCSKDVATVTATLTCDAPFCNTPTDCPVASTPCATITCASHACGTTDLPAGTVVATQTVGDCHRNECDGAGNVASVIDNTDVPPNANPCVAATCTAGVPALSPKPADAVCSAGPPPTFCDGHGACVACVIAADCGAANACATPTCVANVCGVVDAPEGTSCGASQICDGGGACVPLTVSVVRVGTGTQALGLTTAPVTIEQRSAVDGSLLNQTALPTAAAGSNLPLTTIGAAIFGDGDLQRSGDGRFLLVAGYAAPPGTNVTSATADAGGPVPRVIGRIDHARNVDTSTSLTAAAFANQAVRSAASVDGSAFWVGGASPVGATPGGIWYVPFGMAGGGVQLFGGSVRRVRAALGQLYGNGDTTVTPEVFTVGAGLPTTGRQAVQELPGMPRLAGASPWAFVFFDRTPPAGVDTLYVADDRAVGDAGTAQNGIQKWTFDGTNWTNVMAFNLSPAAAFRGVTGIASGSTVTLFGTTGDNRLVMFVDGPGAATGGVVLATAPTNTQFRGVALTPLH